MAPATRLSLVIMAHVAPFTGSEKSAVIWIVAVILGALLGAAWDFWKLVKERPS